MQLPLCFKILFLNSAAVLVAFFIFWLVSIEGLRRLIYDELDQSLHAEVAWVSAALDSFQNHSLSQEEIQHELIQHILLNPRKEVIAIYRENEKIFSNLPVAPMANLRQNQSALAKPLTVQEGFGQSLRLVGRRAAAHEIYIGYSLTDVTVALDELQRALLWLIPVVLILTNTVVFYLFSRFFSTIKALNQYIDDWTQQPLEQELRSRFMPPKEAIWVLVGPVNKVIEKMRQSMRQMLSFSSLTSHELRTPLAIVRAQLESSMQPQLAAETYRKILISVYDEVLRMSRVVDDLLNLANLQAGTFKLDRQRVEWRAFLHAFHDEAVLLCRAKNIALTMTPGPPLWVTIDAMRLREVLFNLLDNALKHTPENGYIRLSYESDAEVMTLRFADSGTGIHSDDLTKIFDLFYRPAHNNNASGSGLGLTLSRWIVEAHQGAITVQSEVGRGTTFIIKLPLPPQRNLLENSNKN